LNLEERMSDSSDVGLYEAMSTLRAVRRLRTDPIPDDVLQRVLQAATWAPSGGNVQPWRVIVVQDEAKRRRLQELYIGPWRDYSKGHQAGIANLTGEARAKQERMIGAADHLAEHMHEAPAILVFCFAPGRMAITDARLERPSVVGGGSVYPAVQNTLLACRAEGLGCTLTTLLCFAEADVTALLEMPDDWYTCAFVPLGYPVGRGHGPISRRSPEKMAFQDSWGTAYGDGR
jgi:nitroreductase